MQKNTNENLTKRELQEEVDELIGENAGERSIDALERKIVRELRRELPKGETVEMKKVGRHAEIVVTNETKRGAHSPYVLDLTELKRKQEIAEKKKEQVRLHLHGTIHKNEVHAGKTHHGYHPLQGHMLACPAQTEEKQDYSKQFTRKRLLPRFYMPYKWKRNFLIFLAAGLLFMTPIKLFSYYASLEETKDQVVEHAQSALADIKTASAALAERNLSGAKKSFGNAEYNFGVADSRIESLNRSLKTVLENIPTGEGTLADAEYLLSAGEKLSGIGADLSETMQIMSENNDKPIVEKISLFQEKILPLISTLKEARDSVNHVNPDILPARDRDSFLKLRRNLEYVTVDAEQLDQLSDSLTYVLGKDMFRRYLIVFQNNNELRPTGGFLGSFAVVDIDKGEIKKIEIPGGGTYDVQGQLLAKVNAPQPLTLVNPKWEFQDANWFPDFPTSAQKIAWFYEKAGGPSVDGVIAINASLVPKLIAATEPIPLPKYGKTLTADNFITETQKSVQFEYDKVENKPKQLLSDMAPILLENIFKQKGENMMRIAKIFKTALDEREIQLYFVNQGVQSKFAEYNWTGEIKKASRDYLSVNAANIRGSKSDQFVNQTVDISSEVFENGEIMNTVSVTRAHTGKSDDVFGKDSNIAYLRFYVPEGSELLYASGFSEIPAEAFEKSADPLVDDELLIDVQGEITVHSVTGMSVNQEFNKTVFGNWLQTDAGETKTVVIKYKLPIKYDFNEVETDGWFDEPETKSIFHSLLLQKQSGIQNAEYNIKIHTPFGKFVNWQYPAGATVEGNLFEYATTQKYDELMALVID